jgi:long-chain acyl-CoA synthetase
MNVMRFALKAKKHSQLRGVAHISTAFVCGERPGHFFEDALDPSKTFSSTYDRTKWEAEQKVRALRSELPITIFRPSIVVGDSRTGRIVSYNVLYTPLRYIGMGAVKIIAGSPNVRLDVVPVDYVTRAVSHIFLNADDAAGKTFNIVCGKERSLTTS